MMMMCCPCRLCHTSISTPSFFANYILWYSSHAPFSSQNVYTIIHEHLYCISNGAYLLHFFSIFLKFSAFKACVLLSTQYCGSYTSIMHYALHSKVITSWTFSDLAIILHSEQTSSLLITYSRPQKLSITSELPWHLRKSISYLFIVCTAPVPLLHRKSSYCNCLLDSLTSLVCL